MSSLIVEVCSVESIFKHPNADKLSIVTMEGKDWHCIVGLDQYQKGDLIVFIPPDAILPDSLIEKYDLLYLKNNGRTGTIKLRGYISQGLVLDMTCLPKGEYTAGQDVKEILNIKKYEVPERNGNIQGTTNKPTRKKLNPLFDKYTDIENIKNFNNVFKIGDQVVITEKVHGSNWRASCLPVYTAHSNIIKRIWAKVKVWFNGSHEFLVGSHNVQLSAINRKGNYYGDDIWNKVAKKYDLKAKIPNGYIVYGEVFGKEGKTKVQDLTYGLEELDLVIFDIKKDGKFLDWDDVVMHCNTWNLKTAPELYIGTYYDGLIQEHTNGKSKLCSTQIREGCVVKMMSETFNPHIGRKILKSISVDYLTRKDGTEYK